MNFIKPNIIFQNQTVVDTTKKICRFIDDVKLCDVVVKYFSKYGWEKNNLKRLSEDDRFDFVEKTIDQIYIQDKDVMYEKIVTYQNEWNKISEHVFNELQKLFDITYVGESYLIANVSPCPIGGYSEKQNSFDVCYKSDTAQNIMSWVSMFVKILWKNKIEEYTLNNKLKRVSKVEQALEKYLLVYVFMMTDLKKYNVKNHLNLADNKSLNYINSEKWDYYLYSLIKSGGMDLFIKEGYEFFKLNLDEDEE